MELQRILTVGTKKMGTLWVGSIKSRHLKYRALITTGRNRVHKLQKITLPGTPLCWMSQEQKARPSGGAGSISCPSQLSIWLSLFPIVGYTPEPSSPSSMSFSPENHFHLNHSHVYRSYVHNSSTTGLLGGRRKKNGTT